MGRKTTAADIEPRVVVIGTSVELNEWLFPMWALTCGFAVLRCDDLPLWMDGVCGDKCALGVIDGHVAGGDVFQVARRVREQGVLTPILGVFDAEDSRALAALPGSGLADAVKRPWDPDLLMARMSALLSHPWGTFTDEVRLGDYSFRLIQEPPRAPPPVSELIARASSVFGLSPSEEELLTILVEERATNAEIAHKLTRSPKTVEFHLKNMLAKSGASDRVELVALVLGLGGGAEQNSSDPSRDSE